MDETRVTASHAALKIYTPWGRSAAVADAREQIQYRVACRKKASTTHNIIIHVECSQLLDLSVIAFVALAPWAAETQTNSITSEYNQYHLGALTPMNNENTDHGTFQFVRSVSLRYSRPLEFRRIVWR